MTLETRSGGLGPRRGTALADTAPVVHRRPGSLPLGTLVAGRYRVVGPLARGGMGMVYQAEDTRFGAPVALKVATLSGGVYELFRARVQREARIGYLLGRSEGLVRALDWGEITPRETLFVVMDLVEGARPLDICRGEREERLRILLAAATLVARVHGHGVVHRDVKPANFLVSREGRIHLADFGEAKDAREEAIGPGDTHLTRTGMTLGTPLYMPPEQFEDPRSVDARADVYALGVMLYQALTGTLPYQAPNTLQLLCRLLQARDGVAPPAPPPRDVDPTVTPELERLCLSALALDRERRLASASAMARELRRLLLPASEPSPVRGPEACASSLGEELGLDADGFVSRAALTVLLRELGETELRARLSNTPALVVREEREVRGETRYRDKVAFLLPRPGRTEVALGRAEGCDLRLRLVTVSSQHLRFQRAGAGWAVVDRGATNGTWLNAERLSPGEETPLGSGDVLLLAEHITLELLWPGDLCAELSQQLGAAPQVYTHVPRGANGSPSDRRTVTSSTRPAARPPAVPRDAATIRDPEADTQRLSRAGTGPATQDATPPPRHARPGRDSTMIVARNGQRAYLLEETLGSGGQGTVHLARVLGEQAFEGFDHPVRVVALKQAHPDQQESLVLERAVYARPERGLVKLLDHGEHEGRGFLVLERLQPTSLDGPRPGDPGPAIDVFAHLLDALHRIHSCKALPLVLCDIKPANVMLRMSGGWELDRAAWGRHLAAGAYEPVFVDVGCAQHRGVLQQARGRVSELVGTPLYLPPEAVSRLDGEGLAPGRYSTKTDIYALTLTFLEHLTGQQPYAHRGLFQLAGRELLAELLALKRDRVRPFDPQALRAAFDAATAEDLLAVIEAGLQPDPDRRPGTLDLQQLCAERFKLAERVRGEERPYRWDSQVGLVRWQTRFPRPDPEAELAVN